MEKIVTIENKKDERFLREKTKPVDIEVLGKRELYAIVAQMRRAMKAANGVGLAANQIGLPYAMFIARVGEKSYTLLNPKLIARSKDEETEEEGCLSVPQKWGQVPRSKEVTLEGIALTGKKIKIEAWGLLARVFQHEVDHLNGGLFIDKATAIADTPTSERLKAKVSSNK